MHTSFAAQLAQLELGHLSLRHPSAEGPADLPADDAVEQTLRAVWSDLFALFPDTALEADAEEIAWGVVNLFHRAAVKRSAQIDRATDEIRCLIASADGSEIHSAELEAQIERAQAAEAAMLGLESLREVAALLYTHETGSSWRPAGGSRLNHSVSTTSAVVSGRDFLRARAKSRRRAALPEGAPVVFAGGRLSFPTDAEAKTFATNVWETLDKVREHVAEMVLVHGGDSKGVDRLASSWAEQRKVPQIAFALDTRLGTRAGFRRNEQMLALNPRYVVAFPGNGVLERLVIQAKEQSIQVVDRRGPLGTNPSTRRGLPRRPSRFSGWAGATGPASHILVSEERGREGNGRRYRHARLSRRARSRKVRRHRVRRMSMGGRWSEEELERFERAALRLPRIELEVLLLSVQDRLRNDEIAARLRISKRRVERHLARALYRFTRFLEEEEQERPWWKFW